MSESAGTPTRPTLRRADEREEDRREGAHTTSDRIVETVHGRLGVEQRLLGMVANLWLSTILQGVVLAWLAVGSEPLEGLPWALLLTVHAFGLLVALGMVYVSLPRARWSRSGSLVRLPAPAWLSVFGFPALVLTPLLIHRDRVARSQFVDAEEIELAFRQLLDVPRVASASFMLCATIAHLVSTLFVAGVFELDATETVVSCMLAITGILPHVAIVGSRSRAILRGEYLSAPRSHTKGFPYHRDLRARLGVPAGIAGVGAVLVPLCAGFLWTGMAASERAQRVAHVSASELLAHAASSDQETLGGFLARHPDHRLVLKTRTFGDPRGIPASGEGALDSDGDGRQDLYVVRDGLRAAAVDLPMSTTLPPSLLIVLACAGLFSAMVALFVITRDVCRDVARTTSQVDAIARGRIPEPLGEGSFSTRELRLLVHSVDRLISRITETNVAKYVVIEKAQEADRLKSQFLANMSHDLRSPLNSILGFSDLLISGIDGEISTEQREMCEMIHSSGRDLLQQIDDILDTAKIEAGRIDLHPEPTPPAALVARAIDRAKRRRGGSKIHYETIMSPGLPPAFVDSFRTSQAIENVIVFAGERMQEGSIEIHVNPSRVDGERMVMIEVKTPASPASAQQLTQVLHGFYRIPGHTGLGLGLPIAGSIVELQGGSLGIEEEVDAKGRPAAGMSFVLMLPAPEARRKLRLQS